MRLMIMSLTLCGMTVAIHGAKKSVVKTVKETSASQLTKREMFVQKYEAIFGEKPSDQVWNLGQKADCNASDCSVCEGGQCAGT
jgi:hypothetical protein